MQQTDSVGKEKVYYQSVTSLVIWWRVLMVGLGWNCTQTHRLHSAGVFLLVFMHRDTITVLISAGHAARCSENLCLMTSLVIWGSSCLGMIIKSLNGCGQLWYQSTSSSSSSKQTRPKWPYESFLWSALGSCQWFMRSSSCRIRSQRCVHTL